MTSTTLSEKLSKKRDAVIQHLKKLGSVLVALSGGVDSAVVAALAFEALGDKAIAVTFDSPLTPPGELEDAIACVRVIGIRHRIETSDEVAIASIADNPRDRCYYCKQHRFRQTLNLAEELGIATVVDGTTLSDMSEYRPGLRALETLGIASPLLEAKVTKEESRQLARFLGLPVADKPSNSCLATRIPYGEPLTHKRLQRIAAAELAVRQLVDVKALRVRDHGELARIEVVPKDLSRFVDTRIAGRLVKKLQALGFKYVTLDLKGYRFGSFDE
ncbi:MAG: ATP-dependent sacrificial sulfur transferase LarE [Promethearchaeota archaeon]